ncbi:MAG TPA: queuosine precursor transporter [Tenuifilaceae bacterium]|nr:queuosine precursor transporter [Tenuifilaceae bacterium]HPE18999.1 queuosine precursor transporter [Tenuifilaceae bacterium]HPJ46152.1 queuosine precursor transporter [Tenuifilaceae bacterium]HPQ34694.1 queuosine precursor transporter [Tenuifilaceae bacterium]HRX68122.1 queuosine precursor transporter [Tenuifilaceae bacterium]
MFDYKSDVDQKLINRREIVFIILVGFFLGTLAMLNILGISRSIHFTIKLFSLEIPVMLFIGILPYPITFLCTDFISELYGKHRANVVVWTGLLLNIWVLFILWIGGVLPPVPDFLPETGLPQPTDPSHSFFHIRKLTFGATIASMLAYLTAQFVDVHVFHFFKRLTKGKHLWLRNNASTLTSQMVDTVSVVLITYYYAKAIQIPDGRGVLETLMIFIFSSYIFKMLAALLDTVPFYFGVKFFSRYLQINPNEEFADEKGEKYK